MTDVTVIRGLGDRPGDDIQDGLLASDAAAIARGYAEIDGSTPASIVTLTCRYREDIDIGDLVEVRDPDQGQAYRAQVAGITFASAGPADLSMTLNLWRPHP